MIAHLRGREEALEPFGWSQEDTEWVAMVCLNSGMFTRTQYADYFNVHHSQAARFVQSLVDLGLAVDEPIPVISTRNRTRACRITHKSIYRELGVPNIGTEETPACPSISGGSCRSITLSTTRTSNGSRPRMRRFGSVRITACRTTGCRIGFTAERPGASPGIST